MTDLH